jgi:hypothetical protein
MAHEHKLSYENVLDITMNCIMVGELYLENNLGEKKLLHKSVLSNFQFFGANTKVLIPLLVNKQTDGVNNYKMQLAVVDILLSVIVIYEKQFANNGESIIYDKGLVTVVNEHNEFVQTESLHLFTAIKESVESL